MLRLCNTQVFRKRSDLFEDSARERAHAAFKDIAHYTYEKGTKRTSEKHLFTNLCHGFDDFVALANGDADTVTLDDIEYLIA